MPLQENSGSDWSPVPTRLVLTKGGVAPVP